MEKMNRPAPYVDASVNRYAAFQMQHMSALRMQKNAQMNALSGQPHFPMAPPSCSQGHNKGKVTQERMQNQNNEANNEPRVESYEQDMEIGYEDDKPSELTFEGLERKFLDKITKLIKELSDAEDAENARHKERIIEINNRYQEKLSSIRVQHGARIEEFHRKESQARLHQYQQATCVPERGPIDPHGYGWVAPHGSAPDGSYREARVPYPHGRVYNNSGACQC